MSHHPLSNQLGWRFSSSKFIPDLSLHFISHLPRLQVTSNLERSVQTELLATTFLLRPSAINLINDDPRTTQSSRHRTHMARRANERSGAEERSGLVMWYAPHLFRSLPLRHRLPVALPTVPHPAFTAMSPPPPPRHHHVTVTLSPPSCGSHVTASPPRRDELNGG